MGYSLFHKQLCGIRFWHNADASTGFGVNVVNLSFAEIVAVFSAPTLILVPEYLFRAFTDASAVPEVRREVYPFLASICTGRTVKQAVRIWKGRIQQGDQVVFQHGLHLGILLVLTMAVL